MSRRPRRPINRHRQKVTSGQVDRSPQAPAATPIVSARRGRRGQGTNRQSGPRASSRSSKSSLWAIIFLAILAGTFPLIIVAIAVSGISSPELARIKEFRADFDERVTFAIQDGDGERIKLSGDRPGPLVGVQPDGSVKVPKNIRDAITSIEDRNFDTHQGISLRGIGRAIINNFRRTSGARRSDGGQLPTQGGSTLTMQLVEMSFDRVGEEVVAKGQVPTEVRTAKNDRRSYGRKLRELVIAPHVERLYEKDEILAMYISRHVFYGPRFSGSQPAYIIGVEELSNRLYGIDSKALTIAQSALIAGLFQAPSLYNPYRNYEKAEKRRNLVLRAMLLNGKIGEAAYRAALVEDTRPLERFNNDLGYVSSQIELEVQAAVSSNPNILTPFGKDDLSIITTVSPSSQRNAATAIERTLEKFDLNSNPEIKVGLIAARPNGEVVALLGGQRFITDPWNNVTLQQPVNPSIPPDLKNARQLGSIFKTTIYQAALEMGGTASSRCSGASVAGISANGSTSTLRDAFTRSNNAVAIRLSNQLGRDEVIATAQRNGLPIYASASPVWPLTVQGRPWDVAQSMLQYVSGAEVPRLHLVRAIRAGNNLDVTIDGLSKAQPLGLRSDGAARMAPLLESVVGSASGTAVRARIDGVVIGGKTGTTNDNRDAWFAGYADGLVVVVWIGTTGSAGSSRMTGGDIAATAFREFISLEPSVASLFEPAPFNLANPMSSDTNWLRTPVTNGC